jgi:hypothetical protein
MRNIRLSVVALAACHLLSPASAATLSEDFSGDPLQHGWHVFGNTNLFKWNATNQNLAVTWDSSQTNSFFYHPLGTILTTNDAFNLQFDLDLQDATAGSYGSELAIGLLRLADATGTNFLRTSGTSPNVAEFDYFPPSAISPSVDATLIDRSNNFYFAYNTVMLSPGTVYQVVLTHAADSATIQGNVFNNGQLVAAMTNVYASTVPMTDFRLDVLSVSSYQDDGFGDTLLAHGTVDNLILTLPAPAVQGLTGNFSNGSWQARFLSQTHWLYTLERTSDFQSWTAVSPALEGNDTNLVLSDFNPPGRGAFYRIMAERP